MAIESDQVEATDSDSSEVKLEGGTYEIIKNRLEQHGKNLQGKLQQLNTARKDIFGSIETTLLKSERITTQNKCIPRDIIPVGNRFIFGYNVYIGLKSKIVLSDVFSIYKYDNQTFQETEPDLINDEKFEGDFHNLYKYYKDTTFSQFVVIGPYLYMVFQIGKNSDNIKVFKWLLGDDDLTYVDNRSDHEYKFPHQHDFEWIRARREFQRVGEHPHVSIEDRVFVETVGGDLTVKVEDNTDSGMGIYAEDVDNKDQTLDDAEIFYSIIGNIILLKIRPYQEKHFRYLIFNEKVQSVVRMDSIEDSCILLPNDQGLIFSNGYYLLSGEYKVFDTDLTDMIFDQRLSSPNGEDYQYVFYNKQLGKYIILSYNIISQSVETPIICSGFCNFDNGEQILFKAGEEPQKNHVIQIWQTPFTGKDYIVESKGNGSLLYKIGNKEIVGCMSECHGILNLLRKEDSFANLYVDIVKESEAIRDTYFWLDKPDAFEIKTVIEEISKAASAAVDEFEKVTRIKKSTQAEIKRVKETTLKLIKDIAGSLFEKVDEYVTALAGLRNIRGEIISLKDLRYTDISLIETLENQVKEEGEKLSNGCIAFLLKPEGLLPYEERVEEQNSRVKDVETTSGGKELEKEVSQTSDDLELLIEIVSNLKIDDPTKTTEIIDRITSIYSVLNQVKSSLKKHVKSLQEREGTAEFNAQIKLLNQAVTNYIDIADTAEKCEEYLTKLLVQLEELEGRFADFDEFIPLLSEKREEMYNAFESKKINLAEQKNKKANALFNASERIIKGIKNRVKKFTTINEINGYFATDLMIDKVRDIIEQLNSLGDPVKADDIQSSLKTVKEDAARQLKDKNDLFVDGQNVIKFGNHHFSVNTQELDLSMILKDETLYYNLAGTDFTELVDSEELQSTKAVWNQEVPSENKDVYRAEYLAYSILQDSLAGNGENPETLNSLPDDELKKYVQKYMGDRYDEGYSKGIHDHDGTILLKGLLTLYLSLDLLVYAPSVRALAKIFWHHFGDDDTKRLINARLKGVNTILNVFSNNSDIEAFSQTIEPLIEQFVTDKKLFFKEMVPQTAKYLCQELMRSDDFIVSSEAEDGYKGFLRSLKTKKAEKLYQESLKNLGDDLKGRFELISEWVAAYIIDFKETDRKEFLDEIVTLLLFDGVSVKNVIETPTRLTLSGLIGDHPVTNDDQYQLSYAGFMEKLDLFKNTVVPMYHRYHQLKKQLVDDFKVQLRLDEFKPRVLSSFVRNKLINEVYLPLVGDNLAKQMGVVGEAKRTDLMGMLLLISPPGYGKTTLMEYIASRLGIVFMKINGPAIGHQVTSLDPAEANNASAREEIEKLNLSFEMGNNVMIYLDDIQHCNPEFLQKFISLCDGQRKIEGVYKGESKTYDLRGKKVVVVMAGNPYTESGDKFQIPDMLTNRADTYNLGDMLRNNEKAFNLSYIENSLTSNPVLNPLATRSQKDVYALIDVAENGTRDGLELEGNYSGEEINEFVAVLKKLLKVRDIILRVNMEYIKSAAQADEYRTEPAFKLQGSYRNMNRIAEKILPVMNDEELDNVILANYENDAQTLTTSAEANLLKWKELNHCIVDEELARWNDIKKTFGKNKLVKDDDQLGQVILQLSNFSDGLGGITQAISEQSETSVAGLKSALSKLEKTDQASTLGLDPKLQNILETIINELKNTIEAVQPAKSEKLYPKALIKMMENQMRIMESWLEPITNTPDEDLESVTEFRQSVEKNLKLQRVLINLFLKERNKLKAAAKVNKEKC